MADVEGVAWSRQMFGEAGPHVRAVAPQVLTAAHNALAAKHIELDLGTAAVYGLMWLAVPRALVRELDRVAGVRPHRPKGAPYEVPVINGVPLVAWRYAKDRATDIADVPFGHPVSDTRRSLFTPVDLPLELDLELGETGLGEEVVAALADEEQQELGGYLDVIRTLTSDGHRIAVLGYASTPDALLRGHLGYADLGEDDRLVWAFREELQLPAISASAVAPPAVAGVRTASAAVEDAFDSGLVAQPILRPRQTGKSEAP
ncbi:hypothetical protein [Pseudonocardia sp. MH-G8]|uniref:hypothetical protein n=1 Tax=Pseudonocardia sp. MH-G8 TaxID=1854588 RepID=UPI000BA0673F|nr:hypothetical protein [Pseudonocardia sp. MH-G8]OZM77239.1 hypothetical protein CFP66_37090 [Pseudonocardia sp. MH-G8]